MEDLQRKYDIILVDSVNFAYRTFKPKGETPLQLSKKSIYRDSVCKFIESSKEIEDKYLKSDGQVYFLFDNYFSKADLRTTYMFVDRKKIEESYKATRKKNTKEFYNSINFLRYYYLIGPAKYHTLRVDGLEADDLVEPLLKKLNAFNGDKNVLLVTTDEDWTRYLLPNIDWIPDLSNGPETIRGFEDRKGFTPTKNNIILYKTLFGDKSDNIEAIAPLNESTLNDFLELIKVVNDPIDVLNLFRSKENWEKYPILRYIDMKDRKDQRKYETKEALFEINVQLVSSIPCSQGVIDQSLTTGRNDDTLYHVVRSAIGLDMTKEFTFGNIRRSRA